MTPDSPAAAHEAAYRQLMSEVGAGREEAADELLDVGFVDHNPIPGQRPGPDGFKQWMSAARAAFPDLTATVEDVVAGSDRIAGRVRYRGTHGGTFLGVEATGRSIEFEAFHIARFRAEKIVEWWGTADLLSALQQMGAVVEASSVTEGHL